jgi:hypothetical protein
MLHVLLMFMPQQLCCCLTPRPCHPAPHVAGTWALLLLQHCIAPKHMHTPLPPSSSSCWQTTLNHRWGVWCLVTLWQPCSQWCATFTSSTNQSVLQARTRNKPDPSPSLCRYITSNTYLAGPLPNSWSRLEHLRVAYEPCCLPSITPQHLFGLAAWLPSAAPCIVALRPRTSNSMLPLRTCLWMRTAVPSIVASGPCCCALPAVGWHPQIEQLLSHAHCMYTCESAHTCPWSTSELYGAVSALQLFPRTARRAVLPSVCFPVKCLLQEKQLRHVPLP